MTTNPEDLDVPSLEKWVDDLADDMLERGVLTDGERESAASKEDRAQTVEEIGLFLEMFALWANALGMDPDEAMITARLGLHYTQDAWDSLKSQVEDESDRLSELPVEELIKLVQEMADRMK